ncbi:unnamed protein product [Malassezia sympodialis ATCC 42132]|uniref:uncharacterized protein n=1 Tax=Malassezia sympodialis (strain ATCC 42132) TaxID=1230383 RepID=UPI0002C28CFA|nr:uncharacterized protein MSY001_0023 [Malassezia sympodialis ATCC 42132]CCU97317.1 unnamed protein product [Malassezia sympodialis ATCC 42132]|eukprot:XP_018738673.1 uncharacterized protein MSY001_0023 [Malassezia sympodialis ATCC 42132]
MLDQLGQVLVISGGSGYNDLIEVTPSAIYVIPGSSSVRLALLAAKRGENKNDLGSPGSREALQKLLAYRLPMGGPIKEIKQEWMEIIEGKHRCYVVPAINTNKTTTIAAKLTDGKTLVGQCEISHPSLDSIMTPTKPAKPPQRSRRFSTELQDSVLGLGESPRLHQLLLRSTSMSQGFQTESSLNDMDGSDFSDEVDDLFEDDAFDIPDVSEVMGNLMYGSKDQAIPLSAPIEPTDFIKCVKVTDYSIISRSLNYVHALDTPGAEPFNVRDYITHVVYVRQGRIDPCVETLENLGIRCIGVDADEADPRLDEH